MWKEPSAGVVVMATISSRARQYLFVTLSTAFTAHLLGPYYPAHLYRAGLAPSMLGVLKSISQAFMGLFDFPTGVFADLYGRRSSGCIGLLLNGVGFLIIALFPRFGVQWLVVAFICIGLGDAFLSGSFEAWITDEYKKMRALDELKFLFSKARSLLPLVGVIAGVIGWFCSSIYLALPIILGGVVLISTCILALLTMIENYGASVTGVEHLKRSLLYLLASRSLQFYTLGYSLVYSMFNFFIFTWPIILLKLELASEMLGIIYILLLISMSTGSAISHILLRRGYSPRTLLYIALVLFSLSFLLVGTLPLLLYVVMSLAILEIGWGLLTPNLIYLRNLMIPSEHRASLLSLISTIASLASSLIVVGISMYIIPQSLPLAYKVASILGAISLLSLYISLSYRADDLPSVDLTDDQPARELYSLPLPAHDKIKPLLI